MLGFRLARLARAAGTLSRPIRTRLVHSTAAVLAKVEIPLPSLGDSITQGTIISWERQENEFVSLDDVLLVVETDKVSCVCGGLWGGEAARWGCPAPGDAPCRRVAPDSGQRGRPFVSGGPAREARGPRGC